jgi:hypothetical protein
MLGRRLWLSSNEIRNRFSSSVSFSDRSLENDYHMLSGRSQVRDLPLPKGNVAQLVRAPKTSFSKFIYRFNFLLQAACLRLSFWLISSVSTPRLKHFLLAKK